MGKTVFFNQTKQQMVGESIDVADTSATRSRGLLKHDGLGQGEGLWIVPCEAIHTFFMRFAIDVVFMDRKKRVTKVVARLRPSRLALSIRAHSVLELAAGAAETAGIEKGDQLETRAAS